LPNESARFICKLDQSQPNRYLKKLYEKYIDFIPNDIDSSQESESFQLKQRWIPLENGNFEDYAFNFPAICRSWQTSGGAPLLEIDTETNKACQSILQTYGVHPDEKFVTLHLAENVDYHSVRRVNDPDSYN
jgi:hypothetical protein